MKAFVAAAVLAAFMAVVMAVLAVTLSPWVLLAWPLCALLFGALVLAETLAPRTVGDVPPCTGCSSPLCPDCTGGRR